MNAAAYRPVIVRTIRATAAALATRLVAEDVEDLAQDTLLALWTRQPKDRVGCEWAYAAKTARNVTLDGLRRRGAKKRGRAQTDSLHDAARPDVATASFEAEILARDELVQMMQIWRRQLSCGAFNVLCLRMVAGLSSEETAHALEMTVVAVDCHLHRARRAVGMVPGRRSARGAW